MENIKVKKLTKYSLFILVLLFAVFSCGKKEEEKSKANAETKVNEKSEKKYDRIVVLDPAVVEMVYLLGGEDKLVGIAKLERSKIWPEEKTEKVESVGTFINPSLEKIIALKPDLVIESFHSSDAIDKSLSSNNIEIIKIQANSIEDIFKNFQKVAKILGKEKEAEKIIAEKRQKIEEIKKIDTTEKKGLFILAPTPMRVFGKGTLPNDIMEMLNIKNIAAGMEGMSPTLTPEYIIKENPDIILTFVKDPQEIVKANPQIKDISAIKNNKFVVLETGQILRGSPRMIDYIADVYQKTK
jgi:hemin-binding periplasmic protein hmuT